LVEKKPYPGKPISFGTVAWISIMNTIHPGEMKNNSPEPVSMGHRPLTLAAF